MLPSRWEQELQSALAARCVDIYSVGLPKALSVAGEDGPLVHEWRFLLSLLLDTGHTWTWEQDCGQLASVLLFYPMAAMLVSRSAILVEKVVWCELWAPRSVESKSLEGEQVHEGGGGAAQLQGSVWKLWWVLFLESVSLTDLHKVASVLTTKSPIGTGGTWLTPAHSPAILASS